MTISVSDELLRLCEDTALGILRYSATVRKSSPELLELLDRTICELQSRYKMEDIAQLNQIAATRNAYRALGKSPHEYRNASEAMLRRIVRGIGLYQINNIVEANNLISVSSGYSLGSYDLSRLSGDIVLRRAPDGEHYEGIGKGAVNIEHLPALYDGIGAFGNPTSDCQRAMIRDDTREILSVIYAFDGGAGLEEWTARYAGLLKTYCGVQSVEAIMLRGPGKAELPAV